MMKPLTVEQFADVQAFVVPLIYKFWFIGVVMGIFIGWYLLPTRDQVAEWFFPSPSERYFYAWGRWGRSRMMVFHRRIWRLRLGLNRFRA